MRKTGVLLAAAVLAAASIDLWVGVRGEMRRPSQEALQTAADKLLQMRHPGDLIVHSPLFSVEELRVLGPVRAGPDRPQPKLLKSRRVLKLDFVDHPMFGFGSPDETTKIGGLLDIQLFEPKGDFEVPLFDLVDDIGPDTLKIERPPGTLKSRCTAPRREGGFGCPGEADWLYIAPRTLRIDGVETPCVWAHPTTGGVLVYELPGQPQPPEGRLLRLQLFAGLTDDAVRGTPDGAVVRTSVLQDGKMKGRRTAPNKIGWAETTLNIDPETKTVLRVTTSRDGRRHHCLNARIIEVPKK